MKYFSKFIKYKNKHHDLLQYGGTLCKLSNLHIYDKQIKLDGEEPIINPYTGEEISNDYSYIKKYIRGERCEEIATVNRTAIGSSAPLVITLTNGNIYYIKKNCNRCTRALCLLEKFIPYHEQRMLELSMMTRENYDVICGGRKIYIKPPESFCYMDNAIEKHIHGATNLVDELKKEDFCLNKIGVYEQLISLIFLIIHEDVAGHSNVVYVDSTKEMYAIDLGEDDDGFSGLDGTKILFSGIPESYYVQYSIPGSAHNKTIPEEIKSRIEFGWMEYA